MNRFLIILSIAALAGCPTVAEEDPAQEACDAQAAGGTAITASDVMDGPELEFEVGYEVTLVDGAAGYVHIDVAEDTEGILWGATDGVVTGLFLDGAEQTLPTAAPSELCPDTITAHYEIDMEPGLWTIQVGPAAVASDFLMLTGGEGHGHEHE